MSDATTTNGQVPAGPAIIMEIDRHLKEAARILRTAPPPFSPELFRVVLLDVADICNLIVEHAGEAPVPAPILFRDRIISEALHLWVQEMRRRMRKAADRQR